MAPFLPLLREEVTQRRHPSRVLSNAWRSLGHAGRQGRFLPNDLPPWAAVYQQWTRWREARVFEGIAHDLSELQRLLLGWPATPSAAIIDGRVLQSPPESGHRAGYDGSMRLQVTAGRHARRQKSDQHPGQVVAEIGLQVNEHGQREKNVWIKRGLREPGALSQRLTAHLPELAPHLLAGRFEVALKLLPAGYHHHAGVGQAHRGFGNGGVEHHRLVGVARVGNMGRQRAGIGRYREKKTLCWRW